MRKDCEQIRQMVITIPNPSCSENRQRKSIIEQSSEERRQRKLQQKNKLLMLLQMDEVLEKRTKVRNQWRKIRLELFSTAPQRRSHDLVRVEKYRLMESRLHQKREEAAKRLNPSIHSLAKFYEKFDLCLEELQERTEIEQLVGTKQLVNLDIINLTESRAKFQERLRNVHIELTQKLTVECQPNGAFWEGHVESKSPNEPLFEWVNVENRNPRHNVSENDTSDKFFEWVVCDF